MQQKLTLVESWCQEYQIFKYSGSKNTLNSRTKEPNTCHLNRIGLASNIVPFNIYKMFSYRRETALQGALVLAKSERLEQGDNILRTL